MIVKVNMIYNTDLNDLFYNVSRKNLKFKWSNTQPELLELLKFVTE